jgi:16S rRNA (guanine(1405)-N(7))-methyltransferase
MTERLDELVTAVRTGARYRTICEPLVRRVGAAELAKRPSFKAAVKETRSKLHQVAGAYLDGAPPYERWLADLRAADDVRTVCRSMMAHHASTRERLPELDTFYARIFDALPPVASVIDIACGLNPLALPWMPLAPGATYAAYDIYDDMTAFLDSALPVFGVAGHATARDVVADPPTERADLALVLKTLPCLDQLAKEAGASLIEVLAARHIVVSYPARSLGGRGKGMVGNYSAQFETLAEARGWAYERLTFETELVYIVRKGDA